MENYFSCVCYINYVYQLKSEVVEMNALNEACFFVADIVPFLASLGTFIYGVKHFFKKGKAYYLQIVTMAFGCYAIGSFYYLCQSITAEEVPEGFTAAYL